ncbi:MAG: ABC transporter permease [Lentisphaerae bacterium]|nr:ABC transporter permease [Lentisphaerota bacterium]
MSVRNIQTLFRREFRAYFNSPVAAVFLVAFLILVGFLTFRVSEFYEVRQASLERFFRWHPWVYLLLVPASTMGLWAEERRTGTLELLLTFPITLTETLIGKFLAAWAFLAIGLACTFPIVLTVGWLGSPDYGAIASGYVGSFLLAGASVAIGAFASALTRSQVISFVTALSACLLLTLAGFEPVTGLFVSWAPWLADAIAACSLLYHFNALCRGVLDVADIAYYLSVIVFMLAAAHLVIENRKAS